MATDTNDHVTAVINGLNQLILSNLHGAAHQQYFPVGNPDEMDDRIKWGKKRADELRKLRTDFENIVTGILS